MGDISTTETGFKLTIYEAPTGVTAPVTKEENKKYTYVRVKSDSDENDPKKDLKITVDYNICSVGSYIAVNEERMVTSVDEKKEGVNDCGEATISFSYTATTTTTKTTYKLAGTKTFTISKDSSDSITLGTQTTTMQLYYLAFNRQVYKPNVIIADILLGNTDISNDNIKKLLGRYVTIERYSKDESQTKATTEETFSGFYIHDILPLKEEKMYPFVRCHIYSLDHQLTLKKYSRAYTGHQLFADILLEGYNKSVTNYTQANFHYNNVASVAELLTVPTYYEQKADSLKDDTLTTFDHLSKEITYTAKTKNSTTNLIEETNVSKTIECIQPYLVQYNESFYDFVVRTANRCGEVFFWDDNALRLGRTCKGIDTLPTGKSLDTTISDSECQSIFYSAFNAAKSYKTEFFTTDSLNDDLKKIPELNHSKAGRKINATCKNDKYYYNEEVNHDIYRTRVYEDKFNSFGKEKLGNEAKYGLSFLSRVLNSTSIFDIIKKIAFYEPISLFVAAAKSGYDNLKGNDLHITNVQGKHTDIRFFKHKKDTTKSDDSDYTYYSSFTTADTKGHVDSKFYETIRKNEEQLSQQLVTFNLNEAKRFRLGQVIKYDSTDYAIIQIKTNLNDNASKFSAIDPEGDAAFSDMKAGVAMQVVAIPVVYTDTAKTKYEVYPPMHPAGHVRHSEPQTAIVADFKDPQRRGRVRIIYPWQYNLDTEASPWIRVLTPSATPGSGCTFPLAVGDEVLINYESNNIERPYVAGSLFNRQNSSRKDMAIISKNGHSISFTNPTDSTKFLQGVSPMYNFFRPFLPNFEAGSLDNLQLTGGITLSDSYGFYKIDMSTDQRKIDISSPFGKVNINAFTGITISAPNGDITIKGQNINIEAGNAVKITSGTNIRDKSYFGVNLDEGWGMAAKQSGWQSLGALADAAIDFIKPAAFEFLDLELLRKIAEVVIRPVDGTMQIKSYKYLLLEAGRGEANIQPDRYKRTKVPKSNDNMLILAGLDGVIQKINEKVDAFIKGIPTKQNTLNTNITAYDQRHAAIAQANAGKLKASCPANGADIATEVYNNLPAGKTYLETDIKADNVQDNDVELPNIKILLNLANDVATAALDYYNHVQQGCQGQANALGTNQMGNPSHPSFGTYYAQLASKVSDAVNDNTIDKFKDYNLDDQALRTMGNTMKEKWFKALLSDVATQPGFPFKFEDDDDWQKYVSNISLDKPFALSGTEAKAIAKNGIFKGYIDAIDWCKDLKDFNHWEAGKPGQIILSDQASHSFYFKQNGDMEIYPNTTTKEKKAILDKFKQMLYSWID